MLACKKLLKRRMHPKIADLSSIQGIIQFLTLKEKKGGSQVGEGLL